MGLHLGKISIDDLKLLLGLYPKLMGKEFEEARQFFLFSEAKLFAEDTIPAVWCHLYELPAKPHFAIAMLAAGGEDALREIAQSQNHIQAIPPAMEKFIGSLDSRYSTKDEVDDLRKSLQFIFGLSVSVLNSFRCLLTFGSYLNDLIVKVRAGGKGADTALLRAIKIDPTVMGCPSVLIRMSRAVMLDDQKFLVKVGRAMNGKLTKREQKNYQKMRLVLQVLHETGAPKLKPDDLYELFREELNLVRDEAGEGDVKNALRQFAYQFMREKSVSETA